MKTENSNSWLFIALAIVAGLMIGAAFAVLPTASDAKPKGAKKGVFYNDFPGGIGSVAGGRYNRDARLVKKPSALTWGKQSGYNNKRFIQNITWKSWGGAVAQGSGFDTESKRDVSIRLSHPKWCGPYKMYQVAWISPSRFGGEARDVAVKCRVVMAYRFPGGWLASSSPRGFYLRGRVSTGTTKWSRWGAFRAVGRGGLTVGGKHKTVLSNPVWCPKAGFVAYMRSKMTYAGKTSVRSYRNVCKKKGLYLPFVP